MPWLPIDGMTHPTHPIPRLRLGNKLHDSFFRALFGGHRLAAAGALRSMLPPALADAIDFDRLEAAEDDFVTPALRHRRADLIFRVPLRDREAWLLWLFEQQHKPQRLMVWRAADYAFAAWRESVEQHRQAQGKDPERLPAIIPLVLYTGRRPWNQPTTLSSLVDLAPPLLDAARPFLPEMTLHVDALHATPDDALRARQAGPLATLGWLLFKHAPRAVDLAARMSGWLDELRAVAALPGGRDALAVMVEYSLRVSEARPEEISEVLAEAIGDEGEEMGMTTGQMLEARGRAEGRVEGKAAGRIEGKAEGKAEGMASLLLDLLAKRFGSVSKTVTQRVQAETRHEVFSRWVERALTAKTADEVIADS